MKRLLALVVAYAPMFALGNILPFEDAPSQRASSSETANSIYRGTGFWKTSTGEVGRYSVKTELVPLSGVDGIAVQNTYQDSTSGRVWSFDFTIDKKENGFSHIWMNGVSVGDGYCFPLIAHSVAHHTDKKCHMEIVVNGLPIEQTVVFKDHAVYVMGSHRLIGVPGVVAWEQEAQHVHAPL